MSDDQLDIAVEVVADSMAFGTRITTLKMRYLEEWDTIMLGCRMLSRTLIEEEHGYTVRLFTATEWQHWVEHTNYPIGDLVQKALEASEPKEFEENDWHVPYYHKGFWQDTGDGTDLEGNTAEQARVISAVTIKHGDDEGILAAGQKHFYDEMKERGGKCYFEHQATPMGLRAVNMTEELDIVFDEGVTHFDRNGKAWSANFHDWVQLRQMGSFQDG